MADNGVDEATRTTYAPGKGRVRNWEERFVAAMNAELTKPFDWQTANCGHLMYASIAACLGDGHPAETELIGHNEDEVKAHITDSGGLVGILGRYFSTVDTWMKAQRGDVVVIRGADGTEAGCVLTDGVLAGKADGRIDRRTTVFYVPVDMGTVFFKVQ